MAVYDLYARERADGPQIALLADRMNAWAFFFPVLWGLVMRQWTWLVAWLLATGLVAAVARGLGLAAEAQMILFFMVNGVMAALVPEWRRWRLRAQGYEWRAATRAPSSAMAEHLLIHQTRTAQP